MQHQPEVISDDLDPLFRSLELELREDQGMSDWVLGGLLMKGYSEVRSS